MDHFVFLDRNLIVGLIKMIFICTDANGKNSNFNQIKPKIKDGIKGFCFGDQEIRRQGYERKEKKETL